MIPFFIDIILEPLRKRAARRWREDAERERRRVEAERAHFKRLKELRQRGCGHASLGQTCPACNYFNRRRHLSFMDDDYSRFYR